METVKQLIRYVTRGFYDVKTVLIMDALLIHIVLTDEDIVHLLGIKSIKEVRSLCMKLRDDRLIVIHTAKEENTGIRPQTKTYYYIHTTETIDAIKWKVYTMKTLLEKRVGADSQPHGFICDVCNSKYSSIDVLDSFSPEQNGFLCSLCGNVLREEDTTSEQYAGQEELGRLMNQIQPIIEALKVIDESHIPENTFQSSLSMALPIPQADEFGNVIGAGTARERAKLGIAKAGDGLAVATNKNAPQSTFQVNITSEKENLELEEKKKQEKSRLAEENALPAWHVESTVGKTLFTESQNDNLSSNPVKSKDTEINNEDQKIQDQSNEDTLAEFYARLAAKQREEEAEKEDEDEDDEENLSDGFEEVDVETKPSNDDDDDDDEDDFEDVPT